VTLHVEDFYMDGFKPVPFCKVCSAEGMKLFDSCSGPLDELFYFKGLSKKEFEEKYQKALDDAKPKL